MNDFEFLSLEAKVRSGACDYTDWYIYSAEHDRRILAATADPFCLAKYGAIILLLPPGPKLPKPSNLEG